MNKSYESHTTVGIEQKYRNLENRIMEDVTRRIKKTGKITSSADYQLNRYHILGNSTKDIEDIVKHAVGDDFPETFALYDDVINKEYTRSKALYEQVNETFIPYEQNAQLQQVTQALIQQSNDELHNITKSMGFKVDMGDGRQVFTPLSDYYNQYLDDAMVEITSGAFDYNSVLRRVVTQMTNSGLRTVDYASGITSRCDVAARRAVMTGLTQLTGKISDTNAQKLRTEYFEIAWHGGARPRHREWQGKIWSREELVTVCGLGTAAGLEGANCYHERYPFIPGISERQWSDEWLAEQNRKEDIPKAFKGKEYTLYEATQRQRYLETNMRAQRQKVELLQKAGVDPDDVMLARCKYQAQMDEYKAFSKKLDLPEQRERIYYDMRGRVAPTEPKNMKKYTEEMMKNATKDTKQYEKFKDVPEKIPVSNSELSKITFADKKEAISYFEGKGITINGKFDLEYLEGIANFNARFSGYMNESKRKLSKITSKKAMRNMAGKYTFNPNNLEPGEITLRDAADMVGLKKEINTSYGIKYFSSDDIMHNYVHEFGHYISDTLDTNGMKMRQTDILKHTFEEMSQKYDNFPKFNRYDMPDITDYVSRYGSANADELFAELFAEYYTSNKPKEMATIFGNTLEKLIVQH